MTAQWREIAGYEELYLISDRGDIVGIKRGKQKFTIDQYGYYRTALCKNGVMQSFYVHRLVALAFIPNPKNKPTVNHKDENKTNDHADNLEWATVGEQNAHGTRSKRANFSCKKVIKQYDASGVLVDVWRGVKNIEATLHIDRHKIADCCKRRIPVYAGFVWRYENEPFF